ncbi:MAG: heavy metal-responsive transcriptional regulator [Vicinamibacterales bacterium]
MTHCMRIGEVAARADVSPDTIRHYEKLGLIPGVTRGDGGFRSFSPEALRRVLLVRRALVFGFSLVELRGYFTARDRGEAPCRQVRAAAGNKLQEVEAQLIELQQLRDEMQRVLGAWDATLAGARDGVAVRLLDGLPPVRKDRTRRTLVNRRQRTSTTRRGTG